MQTPAPNRATLAAFAGAVLIGGANFVAVRYSNEELPPLFGATLRFTAATILFVAINLIGRWPIPRGRALVGPLMYGILGFGVAYALLYYALVGLSGGMGSAIVASVPLATLILAVVHRQERFSARGVVGGVLAIAGIAVLSGRALDGDIRPIYFVSALAAVLAIAESTVLVKGYPRAHPVTTNAIGMGAGAVLLSVASLLFDEEWSLPNETATWVALGWLVAFGSVALFALYLFVISRWTASASNYAITLMPVVAVTLGALIADENVTLELVVGAALVLIAVYVGALSGGSEAPAAAPEVVEPSEQTT